jgi:hypothetical protein
VRRPLDEADLHAPEPREDLLALDEALTQLAGADPAAAELVQLRYFGGLAVPRAAEALGISPRTADRLWAGTRDWLYQKIEGTGPGSVRRVAAAVPGLCCSHTARSCPRRPPANAPAGYAGFAGSLGSYKAHVDKTKKPPARLAQLATPTAWPAAKNGPEPARGPGRRAAGLGQEP